MRIKTVHGSGRIVLGLAAAVVLAGSGVAFATASSVPRGQTYIPAFGVAVTNSKLHALERSVPGLLHPPTGQHKAVGQRRTKPVPGTPGRYLPAMRQGPFPAGVMRVTRAWQVSNGRQMLMVYAGVSSANARQGVIVIFRQDIMAGTQTEKVISVAGSGALTISNAPMGTAAENSALTGSLVLRAASGGTLTLHLATNSIS